MPTFSPTDEEKIGNLIVNLNKKVANSIAINHNLRARREQRRIVFSLCRADAVNGDVSRNFEAMPVRSLEEEEARCVA